MTDALDLSDALDGLVDHHCHGVLTEELDRSVFEGLLNEAARPSPLGTTFFDSALGWAIRRHCSTVLDLEPHASPEDYLARRAELGGAEVTRRMLVQSRISTYLVDTGIAPEDRLTSRGELAAIGGGVAHEVLRLERVAEQVLAAGSTDFAADMEERLRAARAAGVVGVKSIAAYRAGLDLPATKPSYDELTAALAGAEHHRLADRTVSAWLAHSAIEAGLPLQFHVGYGDNDLDLLACDPLQLTSFLRGTEERGVPVLLLHNWPYHRQAAYLTQVFEHAFMDLGLSVHNTGALSTGMLRETLELVPFGKLLFSSDAYGLGELYLLGTLLFRRAMATVLGELVDAGEATVDDAAHLARLVGRENATRAYAL